MKDVMIVGAGDALAMSIAASLMRMGYRASTQTNAVKPPTKEQLAKQAADRERAEWNKAVEAKRAAKKAKKG
jgi:hypothetical protein